MFPSPGKKTTIAIFIVLLNAFAISSMAQTNLLDSFKARVQISKDSTQKLQALLLFCDKWESMSPDTLKKYAAEAKQLSLKQQDLHASIFADYYMAVWLFQVNKIDTALAFTDKTIKEHQKHFSYDEVYTKLMALKGNILVRTTRINDLLAHNLSYIKAAEQHGDTLNIARATLGIGNAYLRLEKLDDALNWYHKALQFMSNPVYKRKLSFIYGNLGITFYHLDKEDSAIHYIKEEIKYAQEDGNLTTQANSYFLYGGLLAEYKHTDEAEQAFTKAVELREKIGDIYYIISDMAQMALFYNDINKPEKGIALCKKGLALLQQNGNDFLNKSNLYESMARNYLALKDYKNYGETLKEQLALRDSIYKKNSEKEVAEMQAKYDVQKKETEIAHQRLLLVKKNYLIYGSLAVFILLVFSAYQLFRRYQQNQQFRLVQAVEREKEISVIAVNEAEENERKRIAADLHDNLGAQANALLYGTEQLKTASQDESVLLDNLQYTARDMMQSLRETAWAMKHSEVTVAEIWLRIINFAKHLSLIFKEFKIATNGDVQTGIIFSSNRALQIILIVQEGINNAVRHSAGDRISIDSNFTESTWQLSITDNGKGFDLATQSNNGIGLTNMQERAVKAGLSIRFDTSPAKGTSIVLLIPPLET
ncbi:MAG: ATP-binding protein [Chitinophagaceae bacterium]